MVSLYYDDPYDTALRQKLDGVDRREKFRLRYYGEKPAFFKLEKEIQGEGLVRQGVVQALPGGGGSGCCGGISPSCWKKRNPWPGSFTPSCAGGWPPKTVVRYTREAFLYAPGNVRVTLDGGHPGRRAGAVPHPQKAAACPGGLGRGGSEIRRLFAGDCQAGGAGPQPAGDGLLQVRPVPPL